MGYEGLTTEPTPGGGEYTLEEARWPSGREMNGYPFTTFTDLSDFLGIPPKKIGSRVKINYMEEYRNRVIKLHAIYSMTISKFTSKTN